jgi:hypothetical protein
MKRDRYERIDPVKTLQRQRESRAEIFTPRKLFIVFEATDRFSYPTRVRILRTGTLDQRIEFLARFAI